MGNIETELSKFMALFQQDGISKPLVSDGDEKENKISDSFGNQAETEYVKGLLSSGRHIVRDQEDLVDRYHGPSTLFALCKDFSNIICKNLGLTAQPAPQCCSSKFEDIGSSSKNGIQESLDRMCREASLEDFFDFQTDYVPIRLPPKQFLLMVQTPFFEQSDFATDIFIQSNFWSQVERLYNRQFAAADEPWAICFHTIILLVLGSEMSTQGNGPLVGSQFAHPFLLAVRTALGNPRFLMAPSLINIQALALLVSSHSGQDDFLYVVTYFLTRVLPLSNIFRRA